MQFSNGVVASIQEVKNEINQGNDELSDWIAGLDPSFFESPDSNVIENQKLISQFVLKSSEFKISEKNSFVNGADTWLIAHAMTFGCIVVTQERFTESTKKVKIPNVCEEFDVQYNNTFEMLEVSGAKFVLGP